METNRSDILEAVLIAALLALVQDPQKDEPHRLILTSKFPLPPWIADPELRTLLKDDLSRTDGLLSDPRVREAFFQWLRDFAESGKPLDPRQMAKDLFRHNPELSRRLIERILRGRGAEERKRLNRLMERIADRLQRGGPLPLPPASSPLSPQATEAMTSLLGEDVELALSEHVESLLMELEPWLGDWSDLATPPSVQPLPGPGRGPSASGLPAAGDALPEIRAPIELPGMEAAPLDSLWVFVAAASLALIAYALRAGLRTRRRVIPRQVWPAPSIPDRFESAASLFDSYRAAMRFALQQRLDGLSHREIEERVGPASRPLTRIFEALYYDLSLARNPAVFPEAPAEFRRFVESLRGRH